MKRQGVVTVSFLLLCGAAAAAEPEAPKPPEGAIVLFDGTTDKDASKWSGAKLNEDGLLLAGATTKDKFGDCLLHLEFLIPEDPKRKSNSGNSGVYIQRRYEIQILNTPKGNPSKGGCGAIYQFKAADTNAAKGPGEWQTYDILFREPRWEEEKADAQPTPGGKPQPRKKLKNARFTVYHNGIRIHNDVETPNKTGSGRPEGPEPGPIYLQNHGYRVAFRNIWLLPLKDGEDPPASALPKEAAAPAKP